MSDASTYLAAFLCGGILCLIGQILIDKTKLTSARILVLYVVVGVILSQALDITWPAGCPRQSQKAVSWGPYWAA